MSTVKTNNVQIGQDADPLKNFTLRQPAVPDGSLILSRGNASAPGSTIFTVNASGAIVLADGTAVGGNGLRNRLINGNGKIHQRGGTGGNTDSTWIADRWSAAISVATITCTGANNFATNPSITGGAAMGVTNGASTKPTLSASDYLGLMHKIEGLNIADLLWGTASAKPVTISFRAYAPQATTISVAVRNSGTTRAYVASVALNVGSGYYSFTVPGDQSGTWLSDNGTGIWISFWGALGSNYIAPSVNAWNAGNYAGTAGMSNICDTANRYFVISDVQLEQGSVATPFDWREYGDELRRCQRYCRGFGTAYITRSDGSFVTGYGVNGMRATPTITNLTSSNTTAYSATTIGSTGDVYVWVSGTGTANSSGSCSALLTSEL